MDVKRSSGPKIRSKMFSRRVGSMTCWLTNKESASEMRGAAAGQLSWGVDQFIPGKLKSPNSNIIMFGRGELNE